MSRTFRALAPIGLIAGGLAFASAAFAEPEPKPKPKDDVAVVGGQDSRAQLGAAHTGGANDSAAVGLLHTADAKAAAAKSAQTSKAAAPSDYLRGAKHK